LSSTRKEADANQPKKVAGGTCRHRRACRRWCSAGQCRNRWQLDDLVDADRNDGTPRADDAAVPDASLSGDVGIIRLRG
jgi:hypothetical protein